MLEPHAGDVDLLEVGGQGLLEEAGVGGLEGDLAQAPLAMVRPSRLTSMALAESPWP